MQCKHKHIQHTEADCLANGAVGCGTLQQLAANVTRPALATSLVVVVVVVARLS